ncbi:MAG: hypothetical protein ABSC26_08415 [Stellaceae bacterium]
MPQFDFDLAKQAGKINRLGIAIVAARSRYGCHPVHPGPFVNLLPVPHKHESTNRYNPSVLDPAVKSWYATFRTEFRPISADGTT